jgi:ABC-type antimicrobial peptide transport system permease subunit
LVPVITKELESFAPDQPEPYVFAADQAMQRLTMKRRFNAWLMSSFGIAGLLIGAGGIFAVMVSIVAQQTREIGIRVALGATPSAIQRDVLTTAIRHVGLGLAIGLPLAWWCSRGFAALLFRVTPADISVYAGVALLLGLVSIGAAIVPARRAARVDPVVSLRR